ncbi:adenosine deaminase [Balneolaceae bacterium YR4-1]|uniref:adenosine deaminase n=1 Tax=Halalkalibaculum roseum TaxID=2709311 RepID=A0A6M1SWD8_9BACT|nr:adenosine deaminase [Halalkalibaculum roseum]NGP77340.1 adenosine deaminase [Halalkalibaculum roseum]
MDINRLPKTELHLHLDSSLSYEAVKKLDPSISRQDFLDTFVAPPKCNDLNDYLKRVEKQVDLLQTLHSLKLAAEGLLEMLEEDNVIYAEIRFAPLLHIRNGLKPHDIVETVLDTFKNAETDIEINLILCNLRYFSEKQSLQTATLVKDFSDRSVVGLDLAGDEKGFPLDNHIAAYRFADKHDLHKTAHAGEACGPESVRETLEKLHPTRIGHGVRSYEDPNLLELLKEKRIHLEVCPTSNIQTNVYDTYADHTIDKLFSEGLSLSVNTDGRTTSNVSLTQEYKKLHETFGWGEEQFLQCNLNAIDAAFITGEKKTDMIQKIQHGYMGHG